MAESGKLNLNLYEEVTDVQKQDDGFQILTNKNTYAAKNVVMATGFYDIPVKMNIEGEDLPKVRTYTRNRMPITGKKSWWSAPTIPLSMQHSKHGAKAPK